MPFAPDTPSQVLARATASLQPLVARHELAGAVTLVADAARVLSLETVGWADIEARVPMAPDTLFWIASQTKPMTAAALMMLVDAGQVDVSAPLSRYLPEFAGQLLRVDSAGGTSMLRAPLRPVTLRDVLGHVSGFPFLTLQEDPHIDIMRLRDAAHLYAQVPLQSEPGTASCYSNIGINLAGRVIEVVSGQPFEQFMQERLFDPLGMSDTTFWPSAALLARLAKSYAPTSANDRGDQSLRAVPIHYLQNPLDDPHRFATPGGGLFSTARDVARFCQMTLRGGGWDGKRLLSPASVDAMTRRQTPDGLAPYGLGWAIGEASYHHGGAYATGMSVFPRHGLVMVFLAQHQDVPDRGDLGQAQWRQSVLDAFAATRHDT